LNMFLTNQVVSYLAASHQGLELVMDILIECLDVRALKGGHVGVKAAKVVAGVSGSSASVGLGIHEELLEKQEATLHVIG
jgi:hypothetical protein